MWPVITTNNHTPRKEILINLYPPCDGFIGQAAIRVGDCMEAYRRPTNDSRKPLS